MLGPETVPYRSYLAHQLCEQMGRGGSCRLALEMTLNRLVSLHDLIQSEKQRIYLARVGRGEMDAGARMFVFDLYSSQHLAQDFAVDIGCGRQSECLVLL